MEMFLGQKGDAAASRLLAVAGTLAIPALVIAAERLCCAHGGEVAQAGMIASLSGLASQFGIEVIRTAHGLHQNITASRIDRQEQAEELEQVRLINEDLARAVGQTVGVIIKKQLGAEADAAPWIVLVEGAEAAWRRLASGHEAALLGPLAEDRLVRAIEINPDQPQFPPMDDASLWRDLLPRLAEHCEPPQTAIADDPRFGEVVEACDRLFRCEFYDTLKHDFEAGGRAYAAVTIRALGETVFRLQRLERTQERHRSQLDRIIELLHLAEERLVKDRVTVNKRFTCFLVLLKRVDKRTERLERRFEEEAEKSRDRQALNNATQDEMLHLLRQLTANMQLAVATNRQPHRSDSAEAIIEQAANSTDPVLLRRAYALKGDFKKAMAFHQQLKAIRELHPTTDPVKQEAEAFEEAMIEGDLLRATWRPREAVSCYERAVAMQPGSRVASVALATALTVVGNNAGEDSTPWATVPKEMVSNYRRAKEIFQSLLSRTSGEEDPAYARYLSGVVVCAVQLRAMGDPVDPAEVEASLKTLIRLEPGYAGNLMTLAAFLGSMADREGEADVYWKRAVAMYPKGVPLRFMYGSYLAEIPGREREAEAMFNECLAINPDEPDVLCGYAKMISQQPGRQSEAEEYLLRAIRSTPNHDNARLNYAAFLSQQTERQQDADKAYADAAIARPSDPRIAKSYARFLLRQQGRRADALVWAARAAELGVHDADAQHIHGLLLSWTDGRDEEAEKAYGRALAIDGSQFASLFGMALLLQRQRGREAEAVVYFERALEVDPLHEGALREFAKLLSRARGRAVEAESLYKRCLHVAGEDPDTLRLYASLLARQPGRLGDAEVLCKRAMKADPSNSHLLGLLASILVMDPLRKEEAELACKAALAALPDDPVVLYNYAELLSSDPARDKETFDLYIRAGSAAPDNVMIQTGLHYFVLAAGMVQNPEDSGKVIAQYGVRDRDPDVVIAGLWLMMLVGKDEELPIALRMLRKHRLDYHGTFPVDKKTRVIEWAVARNHPYSEWLAPLARVLAGNAAPETLDGWTEWLTGRESN